jgi:hypothetical protein
MTVYPSRTRQRGQALVYGLFVLISGLAALFFMFNTGQLTAEKTKLVNTADAVAYSAAVMHARALNFDAYTNRALIANEVLVAQMVSVASWLEYADEHSKRVGPLNCTNQYSVPVGLILLRYEVLCAFMAYPVWAQPVIQGASQAFDGVVTVAMGLTEVSKVALQASQTAMYLAFLPARKQVMQQVADANYAGLGPVQVDTVPLTDNYTLFDGAPFMTRYSGAQRTRFKEVEVKAANRDDFVSKRGWSDSTPGGGCIFLLRGNAAHTSSTTLTNFDSWNATDDGNLRTQMLKLSGFSLRCRTINNYNLGDGRKSARASGGDWYYSGVPSFYDLSSAALGYVSTNSDPKKRDPRLQFAIRLTRADSDQRTSGGTSPVKQTGQMAIYQSDQAKHLMAAVASSEVYFERTTARPGAVEQASLFNPYWQAHLIGNSTTVKAAAIALQGP